VREGGVEVIGHRSFCVATLLISMLAVVVRTQGESALPAFEVASVRHIDSSPLPNLQMAPTGQLFGRASLEGMIWWAYGIRTYERVVTADPEKAGSLQEWYEVNARPPLRAPAPKRPDVMAMLRGMLAERFGLKVRIDSELANATVLRAIKTGAYGPALRPASGDCERLPPGADGNDPRFRAAYLRSGNVTYFGERFRGTATLDEFARIVSFYAQRPVLDRTGLEGMFVIDVAVARTSFPPSCGRCPPPAVSNGPAFVDAMRDQMGLIVRQERQPIRLFVVEAVGPFVEN
jgi:uncharacterized protein (TIGR03435 family)